MMLAFLRPETARIVLLVLIGAGYLAYRLRRWRRRRPADAARTPCRNEEAASSDRRGEDAVSTCPADGELTQTCPQVAGTTGEPDGVPTQAGSQVASTTGVPGEELFARACALPQQEIPDYANNGRHLRVLGQSAAAGYAPAMALLGQYAMRREAWVEAYYWTWRARSRGLKNTYGALREIRMNWSLAGFPDEAENVHLLFSEEQGSVGRALLAMDTGRDMAAAREFIRANHPEFVTEG